MQYKKRSTYTRFFISFLIATIVLEIGAVFFLPSSFGVKEVNAATCAGDTFKNAISTGENCKDFCTNNGYTPSTKISGADCCCKIPKCSKNSCSPQGNRRKGIKGKNCQDICANTSETKVCTLSKTLDCCCGSSASGGSSNATTTRTVTPPPDQECIDEGQVTCKSIGSVVSKNRGTGKSCTTICKEENPKNTKVKVCTMADTKTQTVCCCGDSRNKAYGGSGFLLSCTTTNGVQTCDFTSPIGEGINTIAGKVIKAVTGIVGSLALLMFVWGGFLWLSAAGDEKRIKKGSSTMIWATIGMIAIFGAYAIAEFIIKGLFQQT